jgi:putative addiction module killer protein
MQLLPIELRTMNRELDNPPIVRHIGHSFRVAETQEFASWLARERDLRAVAKIADRIRRAGDGNFGDVKSAGGGISEMRIDYGPGYRVYFIKRGNELVILLCGGDKRTQQADIVEAKRLRDEIERDGGTAPL